MAGFAGFVFLPETRRVTMARFGAFIFVPAALLAAAVPASRSTDAYAQESSDGLPADLEDEEPVDVNRATLNDLLEIPGMDPDLARAIIAYRTEAGPFDSVDALCSSPSITPARLLAVRPWLTAERPRPFLFDVSTTLRSASTPPLRRDFKIAAGRGDFAASFRLRRNVVDSEESAPSLLTSGVLRARPAGWLTLTLGDQAPIEGFGILLGISSRPAPAGALSLPSPYAWNATRNDRLRLTAPAPDGRFLRGAAVGLGRHFMLGVFDYHAGTTTPSEGDRAVGPARLAIAGVQVGGDGWSTTAMPGKASAPKSLAARLAIYDRRAWLGTLAQLPLARGRVAVEVARDPLNRFRYAMAGEARAARRFQFRLSRTGGSRAFLNPLARDSQRAPLSGERLESGLDENRPETAFAARLAPARRIAIEIEVRGAIDPATTRRAWDRPVGTGILRIETSPGGGWALVAETRLENRGAPGPSEEADPPIRRHSARLIAGWQKGRAHLKLEWLGRLDIEVPRNSAAMAALGKIQDVLAVRARVPLSPAFWIGAGVADYRLPSDAPAVLYEERPAGLSPGLFVRGTEQRIHIAGGANLKLIDAGAFVAARRPRFSSNSTAGELSWGATLRLRNGE